MRRRTGITGDLDADHAIVGRVEERWPIWFPDHPAPSVDRWRLLMRRPGARLYVLRTDTEPPVGVLAKMRVGGRHHPVTGPPPPRALRPTLGHGRLDDRQAADREHRGLGTWFSAFGEADAEVRPVRPLDLLEDHDTILMDLVAGRSMRDDLVASSWLVAGRRPMPGDTDERWRRVGSALRRYQETPPDTLVERQATRHAVVEQFLAYDDYLTARLGPDRFPALGRRGARLAASVLPERLLLVPGHHDFAPRNMLVGDDGRVSVIDPLWRWAVPAQEDLCRFLVGMRLLGLRLHTHGLAFRDRELDRLRDRVVEGYGHDMVTAAELHTYEALLLLDKWAAMVAKGAGGGAGNRITGLSLRLASSYVADEVRRTLEAGERAAA
jgi:hypothetical protein